MSKLPSTLPALAAIFRRTAVLCLLALAVHAPLAAQTTVTLTSSNSDSYYVSPFGPTTFIVASGGVQLSGFITGPGDVIKEGASALSLSASNVYEGTTTINGGMLHFQGSGSLYNNGAIAGAIIVNSGGTLAFDRHDFFGNHLANPAATITINAGGHVTNLSNVFNTFTNLTLNGGTLTANGGGSTFFPAYQLKGTVTVGGSSASLMSASGSTNTGIQLGNNTAGGATTFAVADVTGSSAADLTISNRLEDGRDSGSALVASGLVKTGAGTLVLTGDNIYTGGTTISAGTLQLGSGGATGSVTGNITNNAALSFNRSGATTYSGVVSGGGSLTKNGSGTLTLSGANTYTGGTTITAGTLALGASERLANTGAITVNGGTFALGGFNETVGAVSLVSGSITGTGGVLTGSSYAVESGSISAILGGTGALTKTTSGTVTLSGANTYTGGTTISAGTLLLSGANRLAATGALTINGGVLDLGNNALSARSLSGTGGTLASGTLTLDASTASTFSGVVSVATLVLNGSGSLTLAGTEDNPYANAVVNSGTLVLAKDSSAVHAIGAVNTVGLTINSGGTVRLAGQGGDQIFTLTGVQVNTGGTLDLNGHNEGFDTLASTGNGVITNNAPSTTSVLTLGEGNGSGTFFGTLQNGAGTLALTKVGTGTATLAGTGTFTGATTISAGTLALGSDLALPSATMVFVASGATLDAGTHSNQIAALSGAGTVVISPGVSSQLKVGSDNSSTTFSGVLSGSGGVFTKVGSGTLTLTGTNTFTGTTQVMQTFLGNGAIQIGDGGTTGELRGTVYIDDFQRLIHARSDAVTTALNIQSDINGRFVQAGTGTLTLTGTLDRHLRIEVGASAPVVIPTDYAFQGRKLGAGTLILTGGTTGALAATVDAGTLQFGNGGAAPANLGSGGVTIGFGKVVFNHATDAVFGGYLASGGTLQKMGTNTLTLTGDTTFTGRTDIDGGQLVRSNATNASWTSPTFGAGTFVKEGAGVLMLNTNLAHTGGTVVKAGELVLGVRTVAGTLQIDAGATASVGEQFMQSPTAGAGNLVLNGTLLSAPLGHTGRTTLTGTTQYLVAGDRTLSGPLELSFGTFDKRGTDVLTLAGAVTGAANTNFLVRQGTVRITGTLGSNVSVEFGAVLQSDRPDASTWANTITGAGALVKSGAGTLTLTGDSSGLTGPVTLAAGTLNLGVAGALARTNPGESWIFSGGTLQFSAANAQDYSGRFSPVNGQQYRIDTNGQAVTFATPLDSFTGTLTKLGAGTLTLSATNTYGGGTTINGGTLSVASNAHLGGATGPVTLAGGTLRVTAGFTGTRATTLGTGGGRFEVDSGQTLTWNGNIIGAAGNHLTKIGDGTLVLGGANTYSGDTNVNVGTLTLAHAGALSPNTKLHVAPGATFNANGHAPTVGELSGTGTFNLGSAGLTLSHTGNQSFSGTLAGAGGFTKSGPGTLTLGGTHNFTGPTSVTSGRLHLTGSAPSSAFTVSGGKLSGTGTLGALTIASGGTLSPGASPGTLGAGNTTWAGGGAYEWEINNATGTQGTNWDLLAITGGLNITATSGSPFTITLTSLTALDAAGQTPNFNASSNYSFTFVTTTTGITGFSADKFTLNTSGFANPFTAAGWSVAQSGNNLTLNYAGASAIPEPSTYAAIFGGIALAFAAWRNRLRKTITRQVAALQNFTRAGARPRIPPRATRPAHSTPARPSPRSASSR